jgi:two-component system sensor histidine kinase BaeS
VSAPPRRSLAWRLAVVLGVAVVVVLFVVGLVVNRVVSRGFETVLTDQQQQRLDDAAETIAARLDRPGGVLRIQPVVRRLATNLGGEVRVLAADGTVLGAFGLAPGGDAVHYASPITTDLGIRATLEADLPSQGVDRGFLPLFNVTLIAAGIVSVIGIAVVTWWFTARLTRPLSDVAAAARRLEAGDPTARAAGGEDRESAELAEAFNAMADRLERSEMLRRRAASDLAHDLATPATVLVSQLQAMVDGVIPADQTALESARASAMTLGDLVGGLDELATAEAAPLQARPEAVDLGPLAREVTTGLDGLARDRGVRLDIRDPGGVVAWVDRGHVARALRNVVANAIDHSPHRGPVAIDLSSGDSLVRVRVSDAGPGIAEADRPHVFERFYRADPARSPDPATGRPSGSGLGLTIARELLAANAGTIDVETTGPGGTTFVLTLPAAPRAA